MKACRCARHDQQLGGESPLSTRWGEGLVEGKGVHREVESEGSLRQNAALMNKNWMRLVDRMSEPTITKSDTHTEVGYVDPAGIRGKGVGLTRGGLRAHL